jgi:dTDP-4-dehydrorhamnose 3,5-epimerase-like enzyme
MAYILDIPTFEDQRGNLSVLDEIVPYEIKRVYYITKAIGQRGGHRHIKTIQGLVCVSGSCSVYCDDGKKRETILLDSPKKLLIVEPKDWHTMQDFSSDCVLLVISSEHYDRRDYIDEPYSR